MFTGIISDVGTIRAADQRGDTRVVITTAYPAASIALGASIACSGVCLTVVETGSDVSEGFEAGNWFAVEVSGETRACTAPAMWQAGARLNLERALRVGDELGGHIVTGHVDGIGEVVSVEPAGGSHAIRIAAPAALAPHIAAKGSITLDGVSLTVNDVTDQPDGTALFGVNIIPHSWAVTTLNRLTPRTAVNLEIDILARYLARMQARQT